jgi:hypothetical protein
MVDFDSARSEERHHLLLHRHHHQADSAWIIGHDALQPLPIATSFNQTNSEDAAVVEVVRLFRVIYRSL